MNLAAPESQIVPLIVGCSQKALNLSEYLLKNGYFVAAIRQPTVPKNTARLRFTFSALHKTTEIVKLVDIIKKSGML